LFAFTLGMVNLIRPAFFLVLTITLFAGAPTADAAPLTAGSDILVAQGPGTTGGGEFMIVVDDITTFIAFCLQQTQYINFIDAFNVDAISTYALSDPASHGGDGDGRDYLSAQTAFLYTQFREGTLSGYNYSGTDRWSSADLLQNAIWMFEEEIPMILSNPFVLLANDAIDLGEWSGVGNVRAMNLSLNSVEAQDLLMLLPQDGITAVPEPASLVLFGSGASLAAMAHRRNRRRSAKSS